jgi:hypothetical protein
MKQQKDKKIAPKKNRTWIFICLLVLVTFGIYYNSLNAPFIFDDIPKIVNNHDIKKLSNLPEKLVYPYNKEYKTFERNDPSRPLVYHIKLLLWKIEFFWLSFSKCFFTYFECNFSILFNYENTFLCL